MPPVPQRVLYWGSGSAPAWRAMIGLREKGLEYESKLLEMSKGEQKSPEVVALNPRGQVPTFVDQGVAVHESMAILQYLENVYPEPPLIPSDRAEKGQVIQRFHEVNALHQRMIDAVYLKFSWKGTPEQEELFAQKTTALKEELARWDKYLGDSKSGYIAGSAFSIADAALAPNVLAIQRFGATYADFPNILKYVDKMKIHPSIAETWPPHWKGTEGKDWLSKV